MRLVSPSLGGSMECRRGLGVPKLGLGLLRFSVLVDNELQYPIHVERGRFNLTIMLGCWACVNQVVFLFICGYSYILKRYSYVGYI